MMAFEQLGSFANGRALACQPFAERDLIGGELGRSK
jgi:hypothetical protein